MFLEILALTPCVSAGQQCCGPGLVWTVQVYLQTKFLPRPAWRGSVPVRGLEGPRSSAGQEAELRQTEADGQQVEQQGQI